MNMYAIRIDRFGKHKATKFVGYIDQRFFEVSQVPVPIFTMEQAEKLKNALRDNYVYVYSIVNDNGEVVKTISSIKTKQIKLQIKSIFRL